MKILLLSNFNIVPSHIAKCLHFWMVDVTGRGDEYGICRRKKWTGIVIAACLHLLRSFNECNSKLFENYK